MGFAITFCALNKFISLQGHNFFSAVRYNAFKRDVLWYNGTNQKHNSSIMFAHKLQFDNVELDAK